MPQFSGLERNLSRAGAVGLEHDAVGDGDAWLCVHGDEDLADEFESFVALGLFVEFVVTLVRRMKTALGLFSMNGWRPKNAFGMRVLVAVARGGLRSQRRLIRRPCAGSRDARTAFVAGCGTSWVESPF